MTIRNMTADDLPAASRLYLAAYGVEWTEAGARAYLEKFFRFEPGSCFVSVEADGHLSGAVLAFGYEKETGAVLYIQELMVHPDHRKQGLGKALVTRLRDGAGKGPSAVKVKPLVKADTSVLNFYNSLGFERDKHVSFSFSFEG
ncbi:MAG: GNAT family N-acetyltransferase [Polyangiaceae bacterium]|nr:GNAT family N-acetyltransferase [Polyangiaceae bacterium]